MHQMCISTTQISSVMLRLKKLTEWKLKYLKILRGTVSSLFIYLIYIFLHFKVFHIEFSWIGFRIVNRFICGLIFGTAPVITFGTCLVTKFDNIYWPNNVLSQWRYSRDDTILETWPHVYPFTKYILQSCLSLCLVYVYCIGQSMISI
jgi:hypothetical protein